MPPAVRRTPRDTMDQVKMFKRERDRLLRRQRDTMAAGPDEYAEWCEAVAATFEREREAWAALDTWINDDVAVSTLLAWGTGDAVARCDTSAEHWHESAERARRGLIDP